MKNTDLLSSQAAAMTSMVKRLNELCINEFTIETGGGVFLKFYPDSTLIGSSRRIDLFVNKVFSCTWELGVRGLFCTFSVAQGQVPHGTKLEDADTMDEIFVLLQEGGFIRLEDYPGFGVVIFG